MIDEMIESDRQFIALASPEKLSEWWCQISRYEWPADGFQPPPPRWPNQHCRHVRAEQIMDAIEYRNGRKACVRAWNSDMSHDEFELWWNRLIPPNASISRLSAECTC